MSLPQTIIIISLVLLILIVLIGIVVYNSRLRRKIEQLQSELLELNFAPIEDQITRLNAMSLSGESLSTFTTWRLVFEKVKKTKLPELTQQLTDAEADNGHYSIFSTRRLVNSVNKELTESKDDLVNTAAVFEQLLQSNRENETQLNTLLNRYQTMRKAVLSNSFKYGVALDQLEDKLTEMETDFDTVKNLSSQGDHVEAKRVLTRLNASLTTLDDILPVLERAEQELSDEFPAQLKEITTAYKDMLADKYNFPGTDILEEIKRLQEDLQKARNLQTNLDVGELQESNELVSNQIDGLYERLEREIKARKVVDKETDLLVKQFSQSELESTKLIKKLDHIDQSYQLTHGELPEANQLADEVKQMSADFTTDQERVAAGKAVFSNVQVDYERITKRLIAIQKRQQEISTDVDGLYEAERIAKGSLDNFAQEVSLIKRKIDRQALPGLPTNFVDFYQVVVNEIGELNTELERVRINLESISNKLILIQEDVNRLKSETAEITSSANLVELTVQYANKYIGDGRIKEAIAESMRQYQQEYTYKRALDTIATALEEVEPGAFNRIEHDYYAQNDK